MIDTFQPKLLAFDWLLSASAIFRVFLNNFNRIIHILLSSLTITIVDLRMFMC